jgi:lipid-binding SYLF domain-containing protein
MTRLTTTLISAALLFTYSATASAASALDRRVDAATEVIEQLGHMPEQGIPPTLLKNAYGVAVIPSLIKAGFVIGGSYGKGLLVVRRPDGRWSNPSFISMGAGSVGWQVGAQSSDIILVFKSRKGVDSIASGKFTLGGDANIAAGPVGRHTSAATDVQLKAEIYSYSRNRGLFAGISLEGAMISMDKKANYAYYPGNQRSALEILTDDHLPTPARARHFLEVLAARTPALNWSSESSRTARSEPSTIKQESGAAKTYGIDEAPAAGGDIAL